MCAAENNKRKTDLTTSVSITDSPARRAYAGILVFVSHTLNSDDTQILISAILMLNIQIIQMAQICIYMTGTNLLTKSPRVCYKSEMQ